MNGKPTAGDEGPARDTRFDKEASAAVRLGVSTGAGRLLETVWIWSWFDPFFDVVRCRQNKSRYLMSNDIGFRL